MKNVEYFLRAKKALREKLGEKFPKRKSELTFGFLQMFGSCFEGVNEDDYEDDFGAYEEAYYSSDRMRYYDKQSEALVEERFGNEEAWKEYLDYFVDTYFPEWKTTRIS